MGTGDWNDGMNTVGVQGKGESVWLGWFLHATLVTFAGIAAERGEAAPARKWRRFAEQLKAALAESGWDGQWYRRAYFDDGTPLGSADNAECRIDSIAQSWSVLSGAAERPRAHTAMLESWRQLVRRDRRLALLLTPPFNRSVPNPGYIQSYPPGIRENGGQYTHAACWAVFAFAALGENEKAFELFHMLNPIGHGLRQADAERYKVEPYAVAADIYSVEPHAGRGGWTWYTGSAAWLYRAGLEAILGIRRQGAELLVAPCVPDNWPGFEVTLRFGTTTYRLEVRRRGTAAAADDANAIAAPARLPIVEDGGTHHHVIHFERVSREAPPVLRPTQEAAERTAIRVR
jgi:cyclic beta-1,2-glucan synthetase